MNKYLEAGIIVNTHGIGGAMMIKSLCDSNEVLCAIPTLWIKEKGGEYIPRKVLRASLHRGMVLAHLEGFTNPEDAAKFKNRTVYADRDDIPKAEGAHFIVDLIGLPVINADSGKIYGKLADVIKNGAQEIYEVTTEKGVRYMPAVSEFVISVDLEKGIEVRPIEGMFDEI